MDRETLLYLAVAGSIAMFVGSLVLLPIILIKLPADHFSREHNRFESLKNRHPVIRYGVLIVKNGIGALLLLAGIVMIFMPGQGVVTILAALALLDIPGKYRLQQKIIARPAIHKALNAIRRKAGKAEFELPAGETSNE